jgi:hypothetical protein
VANVLSSRYLNNKNLPHYSTNAAQSTKEFPMYNNKCISYRVNPHLLAEGVPVEQLEKSDIKEVPVEDISYSFSWRKPQAKTPLPKAKKSKPKERTHTSHFVRAKDMIPTEEGQKIQEGQEIKVTSSQYLAIMKRKRVTLSLENPEKYAGRAWRIINESTGSYCMRNLVLSGKAIAII